MYSVQNNMPGGVEAEIEQGRNVAEAAKAAGVQHMVYGSAGTGATDTGIPSWDVSRRNEFAVGRETAIGY